MSTQLSQITKKAKLDRKVRFTSGISQGDLGKDEPASGRRSRWAER
jgi:hypothetical protein